ncbi:MAG TPA: DUF1176 domain-containing protein [Blastocatellia bacterium]|nr:DUF1176 domain-containing protein [Blastocatellia bacterium]
MTSNGFIVSTRVALLSFSVLCFNSCSSHDSLPPRASETAQQSSPSPTPAEAAKGAPALKKSDITYEDRKAWRAFLKWPDDCEEAFDYPDKSLGGVEVHRLSDRQHLVAVTCTLGAYQGYQFYYFYDETGPEPAAKLLTFESRESQDNDSLTETRTEEVWGQPTFDEKTKELKVFNRFRGPGDCGILATYEFVNGEPKLKELRAKTACDGKDGGGPEKWKKVALP